MASRFTVRHLLLLVGVVAIACGALFAADSDWTWLAFAGYVILILTRPGRPLARWFPAVLATAVVALSAAGVRPGLDFLAVGFATLFILAMSPALAWRRDGHPHRRALLVAAASVAVMASVVATRWPLRLAFLADRRDFDAFAGRLERGHVLGRPERVGRFLILKAEIREGRPCLWVDADPAGFDGFVRNPPRAPDGSLRGRPNTAFNLWSAVRLDDDWAFISED